MNPHWYRNFFDGITVDFWVAAATPEWTQRDVDLAWQELNLQPGHHVLDCPCGHGRHAVELARRGCRVTGVDISSYCLRLANEAAASAGVKIELVEGDMADLEQLPTCDAAITLGNAFGYLDFAGTSQFVRTVAANLHPGGRWLIDTGIAAESILPNLKAEMEYTLGGIQTKIRNQYLADRSCLETTFEFSAAGKTQTRQNWSFIFTIAEIRRILAAAGLKTLALYSSADREPYSLGSHFLYIVAEKNHAAEKPA